MIFQADYFDEGKCLIEKTHGNYNTKKEERTKNKKIFNNSKRGISAILTLCILLGIAGTCLNVTAMAEETTVATEESKVATGESTVVTEETTVVVEGTTTVAAVETTQELMPMMANECAYNDYYIEGEPDLPVGAMPEGAPVIRGYVSASFLNFVVGLGYSDTNWYYYMQNYRLPNGQLVKYHIWANDYIDIVFHHRR